MLKLNVAVIGVGNMGQHHARIYQEIPDANLVAICDKDKIKGKKFAKQYGCLFYSNYKKMLIEQKIEAVSIVVPTFLHYKVAKDVLKSKKHVLLEKPIAANLQEAKAIIKEAKEKKLKLMVGHIERFNPAIQSLKKIIDHKKLGIIVSILIKRVGLFPPNIKNANVIIDLAVHDIDIINYLLNELPISIELNAGRAIIKHQEDYADILLKYKKSSGLIQVNWITPIKIRELFVTGTRGYAALDFITQQLEVYKMNPNINFYDFKDFINKFGQAKKDRIPVIFQEPLKLELISFIDCIRRNKKPLMTGEDALKALKIALLANKKLNLRGRSKNV